jgi:hypothetical protein
MRAASAFGNLIHLLINRAVSHLQKVYYNRKIKFNFTVLKSLTTCVA